MLVLKLKFDHLYIQTIFVFATELIQHFNNPWLYLVVRNSRSKEVRYIKRFWKKMDVYYHNLLKKNNIIWGGIIIVATIALYWFCWIKPSLWKCLYRVEPISNRSFAHSFCKSFIVYRLGIVARSQTIKNVKKCWKLFALCRTRDTFVSLLRYRVFQKIIINGLACGITCIEKVHELGLLQGKSY